MRKFKYLADYPTIVIEQVQRLIDHEKLGDMLVKKHPSTHVIETDKIIYDAFIMDMKNQSLRQSSQAQ